MIPILYDKNEHDFATHGLGSIPAWIDCTVTEERNGEFYLEGRLPIGAQNVENLAVERLIMAAPAPGKRMQPFRIRAIRKTSDGNALQLTAHHISYQLTENICRPNSIRYADAQDTMDALFTQGGIRPQLNGLFTFSSDIVAPAPVQVTFLDPRSVRSVLGGGDVNLVDLYGGELEFGRYIWTVDLWASRGQVTDKVIRYAFNLESIDASENMAGLVTAYYGWWRNQNGQFFKDTYLTKANVGDYAYPRVEAVDLSSVIEAPEGASQPTDAQMEAALTAYMDGQTANFPQNSITITAVPDTLQDVYLCDTVTVIHPAYGLRRQAKIVKTVFDPIRERYTAVTIGEIKKDITDTIAAMSRRL